MTFFRDSKEIKVILTSIVKSVYVASDAKIGNNWGGVGEKHNMTGLARL